jgi:hypothetical protein
MEAGARESSRRNVLSVQRVLFHHTRSSYRRSGGREVLEVRDPTEISPAFNHTPDLPTSLP